MDVVWDEEHGVWLVFCRLCLSQIAWDVRESSARLAADQHVAECPEMETYHGEGGS